MALLSGELPGAEQVELDCAGDFADARLTWLAGGEFADREIRDAWAAGLLVRRFNAKKDAADGGGPQLGRLATVRSPRQSPATAPALRTTWPHPVRAPATIAREETLSRGYHGVVTLTCQPGRMEDPATASVREPLHRRMRQMTGVSPAQRRAGHRPGRHLAGTQACSPPPDSSSVAAPPVAAARRAMAPGRSGHR
jgi:hypothetical protein